MYKSFLCAALLTLAMGVGSAAPMTLLEEAAEFERLDVSISSDGVGALSIRPCEVCDELKLKLSASTQLKIGGKRMPLATLNLGTLHGGTVYYRPKDGQVTRIEAAH